MARITLFLLLLLLLPQNALCQYEEVAAAFGSTVNEVLALGGRPDAACTFAFNATEFNCGQLIETYEVNHSNPRQCDCYNFCRGEIAGCYAEGETPPLFTCDLYRVVAGCQKDTKTVFSPRGNLTQPCPPGYMCNKEKERNCDDIREIPLRLGLGDVHAGIWCPGYPDRSENGLQLCPAGSYCPNSTTRIPCPKGFFCPHKTSFPELKCSHCEEGAATLQRDPAGYIAAGVVAGLFAVFFLYYLLKQYNADAYDRFMELKGRNYDKIKDRIQSNQRQEKLKALQPKLQIIENRLKQNSQRIHAKEADSVRALNTHTESGKIKFDARRMFDLMDTNQDGELSYEEINVALELNDLQLREFTRRMNRAAKLPPETDAIPREVFVAYFLRVLEQTTHFEPTPTEADELFTEIVDLCGDSVEDEFITHETLFDSPLADFLSEKQINQLIKRFRALQEKHMHNDDPEDDDKKDLEAAFGGGSLRDIDVDATNALVPGTRKKLSFHWGSRRALVPSTPSPQASPSRKEEDAKPDLGRNSLHNCKPPRSRRRSSIAQSIAARHMRRSPRTFVTGEVHRNPFKYKKPIFRKKFDTISREEFIAWYPALLTEVLSEDEEEARLSSILKNQVGVDIAFENLSLTVAVKGNKVKIVDRVTGRLRAGTMTALMGGSGAGKTSLLNALCGRAFYGEVTGVVKINGHKTSIEDHSHTVGFVPQDDIVYPELTVRENLFFSGKFQLPKGTPMQEIEDLADETMASLGLSRVMHSIVGDVTRRGVSGGEKKRVNIGLELMSRPRILFLDEPTSGLDANSALLVMESLKTLVSLQGTTICSVIHQPRKFIYELFDTLILLGVGGKMVYHGPVEEAEEYFKGHNYILPKGESIADWLIDISSGRLGPTREDDGEDSRRARAGLEPTEEEDTDETSSLLRATENGGSVSAPADLEHSGEMNATNSTSLPTREGNSKEYDIDEMIAANQSESQSNIATMRSLLQSTNFETGGDGLQDEAGKAKSRREILYRKWNEHFESLPDEKRAEYEAPTPYDLPGKVEKIAFVKQLGYQLHRCAIVGRRNWTTKVIDTAIIVGATVLVSAMDGPEQPTTPVTLFDVNFERTAEPSRIQDVLQEFPNFFRHALYGNVRNIQMYAAKLSVLLAVLTALAGGKILISKRKEFFREAASGYDVNAYMGAVNIMTTIEVGIQCLISGIVAVWLRNALAKWYSLLIQFVLLGWISTSWALLFPMIVPADNAIMVTGFYVVISSLLFSGNQSPILYKDIYGSKVTGVLCSLFSPARFFIEAMAVVESRCLPVQSGFTNLGENLDGEALRLASFNILGLGQYDLGTITQQSTNGWYWGVLPAFLVGLWLRWVGFGVIHVSERPKQAKKPLSRVMNPRLATHIGLYMAVFGGLLGAAIWSTLRVSSTLE